MRQKRDLFAELLKLSNSSCEPRCERVLRLLLLANSVIVPFEQIVFAARVGPHRGPTASEPVSARKAAQEPISRLRSWLKAALETDTDLLPQSQSGHALDQKEVVRLLAKVRPTAEDLLASRVFSVCPTGITQLVLFGPGALALAQGWSSRIASFIRAGGTVHAHGDQDDPPRVGRSGAVYEDALHLSKSIHLQCGGVENVTHYFSVVLSPPTDAPLPGPFLIRRGGDVTGVEILAFGSTLMPITHWAPGPAIDCFHSYVEKHRDAQGGNCHGLLISRKFSAITIEWLEQRLAVVAAELDRRLQRKPQAQEVMVQRSVRARRGR